jgi:hypothetical protein
LLALQLFSIHDEWSVSPTKATSTTLAGSIAGFMGFALGHLLRGDWVYILVVANGFVLRRYRSRVAALLFILFGLYGMGLALFVVWAIGPDALLVSAPLAVFFASYVWVGGRALAAAIKLRGEFNDDPPSPVSVAKGSS